MVKSTEELDQESNKSWQDYETMIKEFIERHKCTKDIVKFNRKSGFEPTDTSSSSIYRMDSSAEIFNGTPYFINSQNKKFTHYTNIQAFKEIINSGKIRLYNPHYGNDPNEVIFASKSRFENSNDYQSVLNKLFALSMNEGEEDLNMWKLYGNDGIGVGLKFEFENPTDMWNQWYLGKVCYGNTGWINNLDNFHKNLKEVQSNLGERSKLDIDISPMYGFQKSGHFHAENEVRLMFYGTGIYNGVSNNQGIEIRKTLNSTFKKCNYIEYPVFWQENDEKLENNISYQNGPQIRLKEVVLGYKYNEDDLIEIKQWCDEVLRDKFKEDYISRRNNVVNFSISELKKYFN